MRVLREIFEKSGYEERQMDLFLAECYADFLFFAEKVLGFEIAEYHKDWFELAEKFPRLSITAYRGSGKTNFFAAYFIWKAVFTTRSLNFLIVSSSFENSKLVLKIIRTLIADNELLRDFMPKSKEFSWKATELTIRTGTVFYCKTYGEGIRGFRIDYCLCDEAQLYEDKAIFWTAVCPVVQLNMGKIIVIGTTRTKVDLLAELKDNDEYFSRDYPAERENKPLWPQKYTTVEADLPTKRSLVKIKKEMGELFYMQEYMLVPISDANSIFPYEMTSKGLDNVATFLPFGKINEKYFVGVDLAITQTGDYTVYTVISANADGKRIVFAEKFRDSFEEQKRKLLDIFSNFKPAKICIDKTGLGEQIFKDLSVVVPNLEPVHFTYDEKFKLIMDLRQEFEKKNILLPNSKEDLRAYAYTQELLKELGDFVLKVDLQNRTKTKTKFGSGKHDDMVISLSLAIRASQSPYGEASISFI